MKQNTYYGILVAMLACGWMGCNDDAKVTTDGVPENTSAACQDGKDNGGDGQVDCDDEDCKAFAVCQAQETAPTARAARTNTRQTGRTTFFSMAVSFNLTGAIV